MAKEQKQKVYDLTVMLAESEHASLVEDALKNIGIESTDANLTEVDFAYEVSGYNKGVMAVFKFESDPETVENIKKKFKSEPKILRHLLLRDTLKEKKEKKSKPQSKKDKGQSKSQKEGDEPLTNEAIEQKIEEISN